MTAWVEQSRVLLSWSDELLFFAVICWWVGAYGIFGAGRSAGLVRINVGMTALAVALVALVVLLLEVGRLVYPVFEIQLSAEVLALVVSSAYGALHLALLGFTVTAVALSWATRFGLAGRGVGLTAAAAFLAGSFPWLTPTWVNPLVDVGMAVWGCLLALAATTPTATHGERTQPRGD